MVGRRKVSRWQVGLARLLLVAAVVGALIGLIPLAIQGNRVAVLGILAIVSPIVGSAYVEFVGRFIVQTDDPRDSTSI